MRNTANTAHLINEELVAIATRGTATSIPRMHIFGAGGDSIRINDRAALEILQAAVTDALTKE